MPYRTIGLRLTRSYASARNVVTSSRSPPPAQADRAELLPGGPDRLGPALDDLERLLGPGVGAEVEVVAEPAEQRVAHRTADEVQLVPGGGEPATELVGDGGDAA